MRMCDVLGFTPNTFTVSNRLAGHKNVYEECALLKAQLKLAHQLIDELDARIDALENY